MEAFKTEIINKNGEIEEYFIKSEIDRKNFITANNYVEFNNIEDFKCESEYVKKQERINFERKISELLHLDFKKIKFGHFFKIREWKKEKFKIERFNRIKNKLLRR